MEDAPPCVTQAPGGARRPSQIKEEANAQQNQRRMWKKIMETALRLLLSFDLTQDSRMAARLEKFTQGENMLH
ncbi:Granulocyte-Macrophage Colony-Stimulating Factor [Manis pentadactyla]|nr:Granulocyte-Macrophage Colony-Stimulating Factor [Manis pentadactyla]